MQLLSDHGEQRDNYLALAEKKFDPDDIDAYELGLQQAAQRLQSPFGSGLRETFSAREYPGHLDVLVNGDQIMVA